MEPIGEYKVPGDAEKPVTQQVGKLKIYGNSKGHKITPVIPNADEVLKIQHAAQPYFSNKSG